MVIQIAFYQILYAAVLAWGLLIWPLILMHQALILYQNYTDLHSLITIVCTINVITEYGWWLIYAEEPQDKENGIKFLIPWACGPWIALILPELRKLFESAVHCNQGLDCDIPMFPVRTCSQPLTRVCTLMGLKVDWWRESAFIGVSSPT